eukprot:GFUD01032119.1.p1 GENE.GFUD01032119.1~~GFUD01032119.1.p1  ORF type:complete len:687 (+),score=218.93 GFUD01032119.1:36-2096(+)
MEGALSKWTNVMKGWQYRWFVLDDSAGLFSYYTSREKMRRGVRRGCVRLRGALVGIDDEDDSTFTITVDNKTFHFQAKDSEERERWIRALEDTVVRHNMIARRAVGGRQGGGSVKIEDFERKLAETDCYLQLLISQNSELEQQVDKEGGAVYQPLVERVNDMVETVKHAIVLLQIAKNASCPGEEEQLALVHGATGGSEGAEGESVEEARESRAETDSIRSSLSSPRRSPAHIRSAVAKSTSLKNPSTIPAVSYSSSDDDEDDFYDAQDDVASKAGSECGSAALPPLVTPTPSLVSPLTPSEVDWDALYEEDGEEEGDVDMKSHGSVITHLLSQVRIGMDLTKIVLPTFILERRSLLEMYADFFAHPDIFTDIAVKESQEERMVQVLRWYLSSFSASRKSTIAKKPYNPIIGEIFRCWWSLPSIQPPTSPSCTPGPIPWCGPSDLMFLAEQVSHHPPVSAFYVECGARQISFTGHIYTKSAFLGMSVAVHNIGEGRVSLLSTGEDYVVTFPSAYGRSILTTPWVELGGKCDISCPQTGYRAEVEFKCKQFWGTEQNKVVAEVFPPVGISKKSLLKVEGEWNGKMVAKYSSGKTETFLDMSTMPVVPKVVKSVVEQEKHESRRLWREVTQGLKSNNIEQATNGKLALEQKQREEAKDRKEKGVKWDNRMFLPIGENWHFKDPLGNRI